MNPQDIRVREKVPRYAVAIRNTRRLTLVSIRGSSQMGYEPNRDYKHNLADEHAPKSHTNRARAENKTRPASDPIQAMVKSTQLM